MRLELNYIRSQLGSLAGTIFANWLASVFYLLFPILYDIRVNGLHNYTASPSTLVTINHKRDLDIIIAAPILHLRKTLFKDKLRLNFIARDDLFDPSFLSAHFLIPGPIGRIIHKVNIATIMHALRAYPISHLVQKRIGPLLRDVDRVEGDLKLREIIKQDELKEFTKPLNKPYNSDLSELSVSDFLGYEYRELHQRFSDVGILHEDLSRKVKKYLLNKIKKQLQVFARILDDGGSCLLAPEGHLSPDGRFWPVKSGLNRLLSMTESEVRILPVNTTYDFMTRGRMRIFVSIGKEILRPKKLRKVELERLVQRSIISLGPVTMGQLGSEYLLWSLKAHREVINKDELASELKSKVRELSSSGLRLDNRLIAKSSFDRRLHDFIGYCRSKHILEESTPGIFIIKRDKILSGTGFRHWENSVQYSSNELKSLLELSRVF